MLTSIGILAWNEAGAIEATLRSLFEQTALRTPGDPSGSEFEIVIVANGCTDGTAELARRILADLVAQTNRNGIRWMVHEVPEAGKSNAWNRFVHEFSSAGADYLVLMDADIVFGEQRTVANCLRALLADAHACVAVDLPLKDATRKPARNRTVLERISLAGSRESAASSIAISGQFYCARSGVMRSIWMPRGLSVEDGFLSAMVATDCFRSPRDPSRVIRAPDATHYYKTLTSLDSVFRHELRLVLGTAMNCYLTWDLLLFATDPKGPGAGAMIKNRMSNDPDWYRKLIVNAVRNHGIWVLPRDMLFRRFSALRGARGRTLLRRLFMALVGFLLDVPVLITANHRLKRNDPVGYW